jgi:succinoglycan biosynthesis protein ExoU
VAVIIPAYNAEKTIGAAVWSALAQPEVAELVVVDDGSSDATREAACGCDDGTRRLQVITQANAGPSAACNRGVALTTAPVWCVLDADDAFAPHRIAALLEGVGEHWDLAADALVFRFPDGEQRALRPSLDIETLTLTSFVRGNIPQRKTPRSELGYLQPLKRRAFFDELGLRFDPSVRFAEDYMFYAIALAQGARFLWTTGTGYIANVTPGSLSHSPTTADYERLIRFDQELLERRSPAASSALRAHARMMRLKAQYIRIEAALAAGQRWRGLSMAFADPSTTGFVFNHRWRPVLSRRLKRLARFRPPEEAAPSFAE